MAGAFTRLTIALATLVIAIGPTVPIEVGAQAPSLPLRMSAWAVSMANIAAGANAVVEIRIESWTPEQERQQLLAAFVDKGQDTLLRELRRAPVRGRIRIPGRTGPDPNQTRLGWDLRYAVSWPEEGGQRIVVATDRYMTFEEEQSRARSVDYPFTFLEIHLNRNGEGEGKMAVATQLRVDKAKNAIIIENYSTEPVRLERVKIEN